jgi:hypothetical protein
MSRPASAWNVTPFALKVLDQGKSLVSVHHSASTSKPSFVFGDRHG